MIKYNIDIFYYKNMSFFAKSRYGEKLMEFIKFKVGDLLELKKEHPCGDKRFRVLRVGSDIRLSCLGCNRDLTMDRIKLEKATKRIIESSDDQGAPNESRNKS